VLTLWSYKQVLIPVQLRISATLATRVLRRTLATHVLQRTHAIRVQLKTLVIPVTHAILALQSKTALI